MVTNETIEKLTKLANNENAEAQYKLGNCFKKGTGVEKNIDEAIKWYRLSAKQDYEDANAKLKNILKTNK